MADIRLICTDLDGTFMPGKELVAHPDHLSALHDCYARGIHVCAMTARNWSMTRADMQTYGFEGYCAVCNGGAIVEIATQQVMEKNALPDDMLADMMQIMERLRLPYTVFGVHTIYFSGNMLPYYTDSVRAWMRRLTKLGWGMRVDGVSNMAEACAGDALKFAVNPLSEQQLEAAYQQMSDLTPISLSASDVQHVEISDQKANKVWAMRWLAQQLDLDPEQVMALGDHYNDVHMLLWAGTGVAMGNAQPGVQAVADYITRGSNEGGWAQAVRTIALEG